MDAPTETQAEFEARYNARYRSVVFGEDMVSLPCTCEEGGGPTHWAAVRNVPEAIKEHREHEECLAELRKMDPE